MRFALGIISWVFCAGYLSAAEPDPPNILLLFADDLGYEKLSCYGGRDVATTHLDSFAEQSLVFTRAYTSAVCTPSRMSLLTGRYAVNHGFTKVLPVHLGTEKAMDFTAMTTLPQLLRRAGYVTSVTGKWQLATLEHHPNHIDVAGFDSWCVWQIWRNGAKTTRYWDPCFNQDGNVRTDIADRYGPDVLADYVIERMRSAKKSGQPFYIHHNMLLPHWPILPTPNEKTSGEQASLDRNIIYLDQLVGRILRALDQLELADDTWVLFVGDNGTDSDLPRRTRFGEVTGGKAILGDAGMHVPMIIRPPSRFRASHVTRQIDDLIDITDLLPTLCELGNAEIKPTEMKSIDGISFASRLKGTGGTSTRNFVTGAYAGDDCVFDGSWRLHRKASLLYDCRQLPIEKIADDRDPEARSARLRLTKILTDIVRSTE